MVLNPAWGMDIYIYIYYLLLILFINCLYRGSQKKEIQNNISKLNGYIYNSEENNQ